MNTWFKSLLASALLLPAVVQAQSGVGHTVSLSGHFFTSVLAGVIIAVGIQLLIGNLAVALGITAVGDLSEESSSGSSGSSSTSSMTKTGKKAISGMGIFSVVSMSLALFFGTWLAIDLAHSATVLNGAITGLVIWALFFSICLYFDIKFASGMAGKLTTMVQASLSATGSSVASVFSSDNRADPDKFARKTVKAIHDEIRQEFDTNDIDKKIKEYISKATPSFSVKDLRKEVETLLHQIEVEEQYVTDDSDAARKLIVEVANKQSNLDDKQKQQLSQALDDAKAAMREGDTHQQKATAAFDKLSPGDEREGQELRDNIRQYLDQIGQDEVSAEALESDLQKIFEDPANSQQVIVQRYNAMDESTLKAVLASHKDMDDKKAETIISTVKKLAAKANRSIDSATSKDTETTSSTDNLPVKRSKAENRVQQWFDSMQRPELAYRDIKADFMAILDNPKLAPEILSKRVAQFDEKTVRALLTQNSQLSDSDIDEYMARFEEAKQDLNTRLEHYQNEAKKRLDDLQQGAKQKAESVRVLAMTAAWWLFASALVSGIAAAVAGMLASNIV